MAQDINKGKRILLVAEAKAGGQASVMENPVWLSTNEAAISLTEPTADDRTRKGVGADVPAMWANGIDHGDTEIQVKGDPQIGEGEKEIFGTLAMTCKSPLADAVAVAPSGEEEDIPAA